MSFRLRKRSAPLRCPLRHVITDLRCMSAPPTPLRPAPAWANLGCGCAESRGTCNHGPAAPPPDGLGGCDECDPLPSAYPDANADVVMMSGMCGSPRNVCREQFFFPILFESAFVVNSTNPMVLCERSVVAVSHTHTPRRTARPPAAPPRRERDDRKRRHPHM